jgi:hypothetical protein
MRKASATTATPSAQALAGLTSALPPHPPVSDVRPGDTRRLATAAMGTVGINESTTLDDAAVRLAQELSRIPGIERFGGTRLRDLDHSGPRTLRSLWGAAKGHLEASYGEITIGKLLDEYERTRGSTGKGT